MNFQVGSTYRNRYGDYEVLAVKNDVLEVRYRNGERAKLKASIQERIVKNMLAEIALASQSAATEATEHVIAMESVQASISTRGIDVPIVSNTHNPSTMSRADRARRIQADIGRLLTQLSALASNGEQEQIKLKRQQLLELRLAFCLALRNRTSAELDHLRALYSQQMLGKFDLGTGYQNACWACKAPVKAEANDRCPNCTWLTCACGACLCPGYMGGMGRNIEDCENQIELLSYEMYEQLLLIRFARYGWGNYRGKVTPLAEKNDM
ncbi:MAG TPA: hypothetical protein VIL85_05385 [Thermomicrobiales bacterium]|jgi:hypothetical protein